MSLDTAEHAREICLLSVHERVRSFDKLMTQTEARMGDSRTIAETAAAAERLVQASSGRLAPSRKDEGKVNGEAEKSKKLAHRRPVSQKPTEPQPQPTPSVTPNSKKRRDTITGQGKPKFKRARLAKSNGMSHGRGSEGKKAPILADCVIILSHTNTR